MCISGPWPTELPGHRRQQYTFPKTINSKNGGQVGINTSDQAKFKGKIYFTLNRNLYILNGSTGATKQLTNGIDVRDPAVSPDGNTVAFIIRNGDFAQIATIPAAGGSPTVLIDGTGQYNTATDPPKSTAVWYAQPAWSADGKTLLFLSDFQKEDWYQATKIDAPLLDPQLFSIPVATPNARPHNVAFSLFGDGGLRDPSFRPGHPDQLMYTDYRYDATGTQQVVQIEMEDATVVANHPYKYGPGNTPAVSLTPANSNLVNMEPAFSPDGNKIIYVRREDASHMSLYMMNLGNIKTSDPNSYAFDPTSDANEAPALAAYGQSNKLLTNEFVSQPVWSPDGKQLAYIDYNSGTFDIWLATLTQDPKSGVYSFKKDSQVQLTNAQGNLDADSRPVWTP